jgi:phospholipase/carboxylesterase
MRSTFPLADELGLVIVAPDSRGGTWDAIEGRIGPDVGFIDAALRSVFAHVRVNPTHLALAGFSDGASLCAGARARKRRSVQPRDRLFSWFWRPLPPARQALGVHLTRDAGRRAALNNTSRVITPRLRAAGYGVASIASSTAPPAAA